MPADLERLSAQFSVRFERGPDELKDLPAFLGRHGAGLDLSRYDIRVFAEIVDAAALGPAAILERALRMRAAGADVIDLGCLPDTPFLELETVVRELKSAGLAVSVDSGNADELRRAGRAGADYLLSLNEHTLDIADQTGATPVLIPATPADLGSLLRAAEAAEQRAIRAILDPVLEPIHFGFTASLGRYAELRRRLPQAEILMGTGNLTELTDADSGGLTAGLLGICLELAITNVLVVQVSPHTRRTLEEHDAARRLMFAARADASLPRDYGAGLLALHDRRPFPYSRGEIAELAAGVKDANFRIETSDDGIHVYNRDRHVVGQDALALFPLLQVDDDAPHAFYLGTEVNRKRKSPGGWGNGTPRMSRSTGAARPTRSKRMQPPSAPRDPPCGPSSRKRAHAHDPRNHPHHRRP